jgi:Sulfotransferase family
MIERWPSVFVVGAPKAGTTSIYFYLSKMPGIHMSRIKEPNYFSHRIVPSDARYRPIRDKTAYLKLFRGAASGDLLGEASPTYLHDPDAPSLIRQASPCARIIVTLRDPVDLMFSLYRSLLGKGIIYDSFEAAVTRRLNNEPVNWYKPQLRVEFAFYYAALRRYVDVFGVDRIKVLIFEELTRDPAGAMRTVAQFLELPEPKFNEELRTYNRSAVSRSRLARSVLANRTITQTAERILGPGLRRYLRDRLLVRPAAAPAMEEAARDALVALYAEDVARTARLLGRPLPWRHFAARRVVPDA